MFELRHDAGRLSRPNTFRVVHRDGKLLVEAVIRLNEACPAYRVHFTCVPHTRGAVRSRDALLISRHDCSTWICEPARHHHMLPIMTIALIGVPEELPERAA